MINRNHNLVASLDLVDENKLLNIAKLIEDYVFAYKINWPTILSCGKSIISKLGKYGKVICDLKIADVPNTVDLILRQIESESPWGVIGHLFTGKDSVEAMTRRSGDIKVIGVVSMSNPGASVYVNKNYVSLMEDARSSGCYGIVAPGNNYELLRQISKNKGDLKIFSPGIGAQGGNIREALLAGADYPIIGRSLYGNDDPVGYLLNLQ